MEIGDTWKEGRRDCFFIFSLLRQCRLSLLLLSTVTSTHSPFALAFPLTVDATLAGDPVKKDEVVQKDLLLISLPISLALQQIGPA